MLFESMPIYSAVLLPLLLMYLLVTLRMVERRQVPFETRNSVWSIISIRDAALVTLALDLSEISSGITQAFFNNSILPVVLVSVLLALHLMVYFLVATRHTSNDRLRSGNSTRSILDAYFALTLLMTNAATLMDIMRAMGIGL